MINESIPVECHMCGEVVGIYNGDISLGGKVKSENYTRVDGSHPQKHTRGADICPHCGNFVPVIIQLQASGKKARAQAIDGTPSAGVP